MKAKTLRASTSVPIYGVHLRLILTPDICEERLNLSDLFGPYRFKDERYTDALHSFLGAEAALFFKPDTVNYAVIAHEIFHLTHAIMDYSNVHFQNENHEAFALLNGYLHTWVHCTLNKLLGIKL